jgi:hypothetical protein
METLADYAYRLLGDLFAAQVVPVAAALDEAPSALEEGRGGSASARAAAIRARLAELCAESGPPSREDAQAAYEATTSLLYDLWRVVAGDAREAGPAAAEWAQSAVARAVAAK